MDLACEEDPLGFPIVVGPSSHDVGIDSTKDQRKAHRPEDLAAERMVRLWGVEHLRPAVVRAHDKPPSNEAEDEDKDTGPGVNLLAPLVVVTRVPIGPEENQAEYSPGHPQHDSMDERPVGFLTYQSFTDDNFAGTICKERHYIIS